MENWAGIVACMAIGLQQTPEKLEHGLTLSPKLNPKP